MGARDYFDYAIVVEQGGQVVEVIDLSSPQALDVGDEVPAFGLRITAREPHDTKDAQLRAERLA